VDNRLSVRRIGDMAFGLLAIVAGIGLIVGMMAGGQVSSLVLVAIPLVVIGWAAYYGIVARLSSTGLEHPHPSDHREEI